MKKYFWGLSTFCILNSTLAGEGVVIVLEAPLLKEPTLSSKVVQTLRKGKRIYIPNEILRTSSSLPEFIPTLDRTGQRAYIPSKYIKAIYHTDREYETPVTIADHDPTDYRLEEPIPSTYPFAETSRGRASLSFYMGNNLNSPYQYSNSFQDQQYNPEMGLRVNIMKKAQHDRTDRFYFGTLIVLTTTKNSIEFTDQTVSNEGRDMLRLGPALAYDAYKKNNLRFSIGTGFTVNYHKATLERQSLTQTEERLFSGFSFSPFINTSVFFTDVFPKTDIITGFDVSFFLPHTLKSSTQIEIPELWEENDQVIGGAKTQVSGFVGLQVKF